MKYNIPEHLIGLSEREVAESQKKHGKNLLHTSANHSALELLIDILKEPMLLLLLAVSIIYVIVGNYSEAIFMFGAIIAVSGISFYQDNRSKKALEALQKLNEPHSTVIRQGQMQKIATTDISVGDLCVISEGKTINADGILVHSSDFSVNESSLTGESLSVYKNTESNNNQVYSGTLVVSGWAVIQVEKIGKKTRLGEIGTAVRTLDEERSPLQIQIGKFVKGMAIGGIVVFLMVWGFSFWKTGDWIESLLTGLTLAMSILPEEIPVAFTTFMALGSWKLMQEGILIKKSSVVETLGSTTVICTDKTGTITENSMKLKALYEFSTDQIFDEEHFASPALSELITYAMWSSEPVPFDPMEKTIHQVYENSQPTDYRKAFEMVHEYPLEGKPPMMTHIFQNKNGERIIAAKGSPEAIIASCKLSPEQKTHLRSKIKELGQQGYRILGVAKSDYSEKTFPETQRELPFDFLGFTVFYDPPKAGIQQVFEQIYQAGIKVKVITGDNADTTFAIAQQAGIRTESQGIEGAKIMELPEADQMEVSRKTTLFTRMFPEAKLAVVQALKKDGEVVAMLGDGVNDAPALKAAHIGVAMGTKGTEMAKESASLVITNDDLSQLITAIASGRRIYSNIKKAIQYIISIHIPIILTVSLPLFLGWLYPNILTPVHVIFLELVMGPTCSIVYENEPMEPNAMRQSPRRMTDTFLNFRELSISIIQGLLITVGVLFSYQLALNTGADEASIRAMVFSTLIFSNVFLCLVNRSFVYSIWDSLHYKNRLFPLVIGATLTLFFAILYIPPIAEFFKLNPLNANELGISLGIAAVSVLWFELYKAIKRQFILKNEYQ